MNYDNTTSFPSHDIDPRKKGKDWCLQFSKASWSNAEHAQPRTMFYHYARKYDKIRYYAHGRQDTAQYKKAVHVDDQSNTTVAVLDFKVLPLVKKHRQVGLGMLQKSDYQIVASAIDALAKDEADQYFAELTAKLMMKSEFQKQGSPLASAPVLQGKPGEADNLEELLLQKEYGFKHDYAIAVEEGIDLIFYQNSITQCRYQVIEDLYDFGVAVYKDWMEPSGRIRFRKCDPRAMITNYCRYEDFSDLLYAGEVVTLSWNDFREQSNGQFSEGEFEQIFNASKVQNSNNSYTNYRNVSDKFKIKVLDLEWFSVDEQVYAEKKTKEGNTDFSRTKYTSVGGDKTKIKRYKRKTIYRAKWIVGTDFIYDYGLAPFIKRYNLSNTQLSYHIVATNFHDMNAIGIMEDVIPIADQMAIAWLKLQNIRNQMIPYAWDIDLDSIEEVQLSKGGEAMQPKDVIQMFYQNGILINRRKGLKGENSTNFRSIEFVQTNFGELIAAAWQDFRNFEDLLSRATGFNELTNGNTPNPKTQNPATAAAIESTSNALFHIVRAEKLLLEKLANAVQCRLKRAVKMGKVSGYIPALGESTVKYIEIAPDIDDHDYGLVLEDAPTNEDKQFIQQEMYKYAQEGLLDATDLLVIRNTRNMKQAEKILAMRVARRKKEQQELAAQQQQQNGQIQIQSNQVAENEKRQTLQLEYALKEKLTDREKGWEYKIMELQMAIKTGQTIAQIQSTEKMQEKELGIEPEITLDQTPLPAPQEQGQPEQQGQQMAQ